MKKALKLLITALLMSSGVASHAAVLPPDAVIGGKTISEWSAEWWKWVFPVSTNTHPLLDPDGRYAHAGQPAGEVFFVAGSWALPHMTTTVARAFCILEGQYLFFPVVNFWADNVFADHPWSVDELRQFNEQLVAATTNLHAAIDGVPVTNLISHRAISPIFSCLLTNADNLESYAADQAFTGLNDPIVADGFWLMLEPLPPGIHVLRFGATLLPPTDFTIDITANITVVTNPVMPTNTVVGGKTIGEWTVDWWKRVYEVSTNTTWHLDYNGARAVLNQPTNEVFMLGSFAPDRSIPTQRSFNVPFGKYLLTPLLVATADNVDSTPLTVDELRAMLASIVTNHQELHLTIDGMTVPMLASHRVISPVFSLNFTNADNFYSIWYQRPFTGLVDPVVADGYWVLLEPLSPGPHVIRYGGSWAQHSPFKNFDFTAYLTVMTNPVVAPNTTVAGRTIAEWTVDWWKLMFDHTTNHNPMLDPDGRYAHHQPPGPVFFIPGALVDTPQTIHRQYHVPANRYLLFPLLTAEVDNIDVNPPMTVSELRGMASNYFEPPPDLYFEVDSQPLTNLLAHREPAPVFSHYFTNADNVLTLFYPHTVTGLIDPIVLDGYWIMLNPLPPGTHVFHFGGQYRIPGGTSFDRVDIITIGENFELPVPNTNRQVYLQFHGVYGRNYTLQASTNLLYWMPLSTNQAPVQPLIFLDPYAASFPHRFYRLLSTP